MIKYLNSTKGVKMKILTILVLGISFLFASIDMNNASIKELSSLNGIGAKKAAAIIEYRKGHCFQSLNDITNVKGLGKKFLEKNKAQMTLGKCK